MNDSTGFRFSISMRVESNGWGKNDKINMKKKVNYETTKLIFRLGNGYESKQVDSDFTTIISCLNFILESLKCTCSLFKAVEIRETRFTAIVMQVHIIKPQNWMLLLLPTALLWGILIFFLLLTVYMNYMQNRISSSSTMSWSLLCRDGKK